ncbi:GT2 family glycosyltransferase [Pedobacter cryoconitis]|uniref:GT2 family glycosyltransferase n=1 Tax=Pedobacter cryoconitis TaxID=188932 RepID=A0A7W9DZY0_9SPHI|nr:glycosyltransferase [Pedobacter cryoconitis]MBB5637822.1 GT2 family glycosyltransferase [Pedobacter cryoconitis]MBB6270422.1 GT2 family glycosyltransferase [Pedobacter cryoconitis]
MGKKVEIDVIILSYGQTNELKDMTINCLNSLMNSEDPEKIKFNVIVIESEKTLKPYQYLHGLTVYPKEEFGYHRYMNIGIAMTSADFICMCNNDLIFHPNWATEILQPFHQYSDLSSASPVCSIHHPKEGFKLNDGLKLGYRVRKEISGWCIFFKRDILRLTGKLDENYIFWCADNDYSNTLWMLKLKHVLVTSSIVDHLENKTLKSQTAERQEELTENETVYYDKKWRPRTGDGWVLL